MRVSRLLGGTPAVALLMCQAVSACGGNGAAAPDAGVESDGPHDGEAEASPETRPGSDAVSDAGSDATLPDASVGTSFCSKLSPPPTFCSDFDEGPSSLAPWTIDTTNAYYGKPDGGIVAIDTSTFTSSPASLSQMTAPAGADAGEYQASQSDRGPVTHRSPCDTGNALNGPLPGVVG